MSAPDTVAARAVDLAREALLADAPAEQVGEHLGVVAEDGNAVTHFFACTSPGYVGWRWAVTVVRAALQRQVTVDEIVLLPTDEAIVAPAWVPYKERLRAGDLSPGDLLPVEDDDPRLVPTYSFGDDPLDTDAKAQIRTVAQDLGLGRTRTLSPEGLLQTAQRWYDGDAGPHSPLAQAAPGACRGCGFLVRIGGMLAETFGVCANGNANDDGRVVSLDHGCGAHSEVRLGRRHQPQSLPDNYLDTLAEDLERF